MTATLLTIIQELILLNSTKWNLVFSPNKIYGAVLRGQVKNMYSIKNPCPLLLIWMVGCERRWGREDRDPAQTVALPEKEHPGGVHWIVSGAAGQEMGGRNVQHPEGTIFYQVAWVHSRPSGIITWAEPDAVLLKLFCWAVTYAEKDCVDQMQNSGDSACTTTSNKLYHQQGISCTSIFLFWFWSIRCKTLHSVTLSMVSPYNEHMCEAAHNNKKEN